MISYSACPCCGQKNLAFVFSVKDYTVSHEQFEIWECENCTLRLTQNVPEENYISHRDTNEGLVNKLYHKVRTRTLANKRKLIEKLTGPKAGSILDVGCGIGAFLRTMQQAG